MNANEINGYETLTKSRQTLVDTLFNNLDKGHLWSSGWKMPESPVSGITGKRYKGSNRLLLFLVGMQEKYEDNRWVTYKQMEERGWTFKKDEEGKSLGKGKGVPVEFYDLRDKKTGKSFDRSVLDGMTVVEKEEYMDDNVYPLRKSYVVFNGDIIDGIPKKEEKEQCDVNERIDKAESILDYWNTNESRIIHGGHDAFYKIADDTIHLPERKDFHSTQAYYSTAFHEIGHSTGHEKRLNRDIENKFGTPEYAMEELRAEIASLFMEQDIGIEQSETHIQNNAAYIDSWKKEIKEDPNALFTAIADADKISRYVISKENEAEKKKNTEYYTIVESENDYGDTVYKIYITAEYGQTTPAINYNFTDKDALLKEFEKMKSLPFWKDKTFEEVKDMDELTEKSIERAKAEEFIQEKSEEYYRPMVESGEAQAARKPLENIDGRGVESLTQMSDRDVVERASKAKNGEKFSQLYGGVDVLGNADKSSRSLMTRLAMFCKDKDQMIRIFRSSGFFDDSKPNSFYMQLADDSLDFVNRIKTSASENTPVAMKTVKNFAGNAKR